VNNYQVGDEQKVKKLMVFVLNLSQPKFRKYLLGIKKFDPNL
jgi:hypothetical protein